MLKFLTGILLITRLLSPAGRCGEQYYTGFDAFTPGFETIAGTEGWLASSSHAGRALNGVDAESTHGLAGIGNAAFIGGNAAVLPPAITNRTVNVRKPFTLDPVALGQEVMVFRVNFGIKDSTLSGTAVRRDNFEFAFYNTSSQLLGFVQFDNSTLSSGVPVQKIWRSSWTGSSFTKLDTGGTFLYDVLQEIQVRINYRTNRWSAALDGVDLFTDEVFYSGSQTRNAGPVAAQMQIISTAVYPGTSQMGLAPGNNYMLFDDFALRTDPVPDPAILTLTKNPGGSAQLTWLSEALYKYQLEYKDDLASSWKKDLPSSFITAADTGESAVFTDSTATGVARRFYRIVRSPP